MRLADELYKEYCTDNGSCRKHKIVQLQQHLADEVQQRQRVLAQVATLKQELQDAKADCQRANQGHNYGDVIQSLRTELRSQEADVEKARNLLHRAE